MADDTAANRTPPVSFYFLVDFQSKGDHFQTSFSEVSGLSTQLNICDKPNGTEVWIKMPGPLTYGTITLKRHSTFQPNDKFSQWVNRCLKTDRDGYIKPYDVIIKLLDKDRQPLGGWQCSHAYPTKWTMDGLDSTKSGLAMETVTLTCNRIERVTM